MNEFRKETEKNAGILSEKSISRIICSNLTIETMNRFFGTHTVLDLLEISMWLNWKSENMMISPIVYWERYSLEVNDGFSEKNILFICLISFEENLIKYFNTD